MKMQALALVTGLSVVAGIVQGNDGAAARETVLDRKVRVGAEWVMDIPDTPRHCDTLPVEQRRVDIGDCRLFCCMEGEGSLLVLVHGGPGATHHGFHPWFSRAAGFSRVIYYDQRGCGLSDYEPGPGYSTAQAVDDLDRLRQALGADHWIVAGHSYGGYVAQHYAVKYPERMAGLILICAQPAVTMRLGTRQHDYISRQEREKIIAAHQARDLTPEQRLFNAHLNGDWKRQNFYRPDEADLARMTRYEWVHDPRFRASINTFMPDLQGFFDESPFPILVMEGRWDLTWSADKPEKMPAAFPRARMVVFENSAHSPFRDEPEPFFAELEKFVRKAQAPAPAAAAAWRQKHETLRQTSPAHVIAGLMSGAGGWSMDASKKIATAYKPEWLPELDPSSDSLLLLRLGFALYDTGRYEDALAVFQRSRNLVWQGQMLDLIGRREAALECYREVQRTKAYGARHDQYGIHVTPEYIARLIEQPFKRAGNDF